MKVTLYNGKESETIYRAVDKFCLIAYKKLSFVLSQLHTSAFFVQIYPVYTSLITKFHSHIDGKMIKALWIISRFKKN